jgi:hypothetical protein
MAEEIKAEVQFEITDLKDAIDDLNGSVQDFIEAFSSDFVDKVNTGSSALKESLSGVSEAAKDITKEVKSSTEEQKKELLTLSQQYDKWLADMKRKGGLRGALAEGMPQQLTGLQTGVQKFKQSLLSELPFGGLIGMALLGAKREQEVFATGARAARLFQQTGDVASRQMARVGNDIRRLGVMLGKGPDGLAGEFNAAAAAFAQGGVDIQEVLETKIDRPIRGSRGSILETSIAIDSLFKQAAGTAARQMTAMIRDFNLDAKTSADVVAAIGFSARDSGTSVQSFTESVMRSATALRTQRVDITEVASAQLKFQQILEQGMPGTRAEFRAGYAERAIGQVTQGLANMNVGLTAVLGERVSRTMGEPVTGLQAYYLMREGLGGKGQLSEEEQGYFAQSLKELGALAAEGGRTEEEQRFFLERMGFGFEGAKAIQSMSAELEKTGGDQVEMQKVVAAHSEELRDAFKDRAAEQTDLLKSLVKMQDGVARLSAGILGALITGFQGMIHGIRQIVIALTGTETEKAAAKKYSDVLGEQATRAYDMLNRGIEQTLQGAEMGFLSVLATGRGGKFRGYQDILEQEERRAADIAAGRAYDVPMGEGSVTIHADERQRIIKAAEDERLRRSTIGVMGEIRRETDVLMHPGLYKELEETYKKAERGGQAGEEAVFKRMQEEGVRRAKGGKELGFGMQARLKSAELGSEEGYIDLGEGRGKAKVKVVLQAVDYKPPGKLPEE